MFYFAIPRFYHTLAMIRLHNKYILLKIYYVEWEEDSLAQILSWHEYLYY